MRFGRCVDTRHQVPAQISQKANMPFGCELAYSSKNPPWRQNREKPKTDHRICEESGIQEVGVIAREDFVEIRYRLAQLSTDTASKEITERR